MSQTSAFLGWLMLPHVEHKKAYLFTGRPTLDFFDLETKTWGSISTQFQHSGQADTIAGIKPGLNSWPYPKNQLTDSTQQLLGDKLYVFGGTHGTTSIGCNLFLVLDLKTRSWKRLSGTVMPTQDDDPREPGPRKTPCSWADPIGGRFYLLFGECDRMGAAYSGEIHGADHGYAFNDFWSWHPDETFWRRERWLGNVPGARSESACVYVRLPTSIFSRIFTLEYRTLKSIKPLCGEDTTLISQRYFTIMVLLLLSLISLTPSSTTALQILMTGFLINTIFDHGDKSSLPHSRHIAHNP